MPKLDLTPILDLTPLDEESDRPPERLEPDLTEPIPRPSVGATGTWGAGATGTWEEESPEQRRIRAAVDLYAARKEGEAAETDIAGLESQQRSIGALATPVRTIANLPQRWRGEPDKFTRPLLQTSVPADDKSILAGVGRVGAKLVNAPFDPDEALKLMAFGGGAVPKLLATVPMAEGVPEQIEHAASVLNDPNATPADITEAVLDPAATTAMLGMVAGHSSIPRPVIETISKAESTGALNKSVAAAKEAVTKEQPKQEVADVSKTETASESQTVQEAAAVAREPARGQGGEESPVLLKPEPAAATTAGVPSAELTADIARYNEIQAAIKSDPEALFGPLWKENEAIKNKYGGYVPVEPPAKAGRAPTVEKFEVSVQAEDPANPGTGFVQIVDTGVKAENVKSPTVESLREAGVDVPDFSALPTGKYTWEEANEKARAAEGGAKPIPARQAPVVEPGVGAVPENVSGAKLKPYTIGKKVIVERQYGVDATVYKWPGNKVEIAGRPDLDVSVYKAKSGWIVNADGRSIGKQSKGVGQIGFDTPKEAVESYIKTIKPAAQPLPEPAGPKAKKAGGELPAASQALPAAETKLAEIVNRTVEATSPTRLGATAGASARPLDVVLGASDLRSISPAVEARWQAAVKGTETLLDKIKSGTESAWKSITREYPDLPPREFPREIDTLRRARASRNASARTTVDVLKGITNDLGPKQYGVFNRVALLEDLVKDVEAGKYASGQDLPFGYKNAGELAADLNKFKAVSESTPQIKAALERRREFMDTLRSTLVERGFLPESILQDSRYFHHQVLLYMAEKNAPTGSRSFRDWFSGWQKKRTGSSLDYNRQYVEAEAAVLSDAFNKITMQDLHGEMQGIADIFGELKKVHGDQWREHIPKNYTTWQPKRGNIFYPVETVAERVMDRYLSGLGDILPSEFREALAVGGRRQEWVIPKPLAKVLDNIAPRPDNWIGNLAKTMDRSWKKYILLNPLRAAKYNLNNLSGDLDFLFAAQPKIFKEFKSSASDMWGFHVKGKAAVGDIKEAMQDGVIGSGWRSSELPNIARSDYFNWLTGEKPKLVDRYWDWIGKRNDAREDTGRLASYRFARKEWEAGRPFYGASVPADVNALATPRLKSAKVAREILIDYGRGTEFSNFTRERIVPFFKWMEGNFVRYQQLIRNVPVQEGGGQRLAGATAKKAATLTARMGAAYGIINLWNHLFFPQEEEELGEGRNQLHLILGRDDQGNIQTIRFQGALSDLLGWVGGEDLPKDVQELASGKASVGDKMEDAYEAAISRGANASLPFAKTAAEVGLGRSFYPNALEPRPVRDKAEHAAGLFSLKPVYQWLAGKPHKPLRKELASLITYTTDPGEAAYNTTRHMAGEWLEDQGEERANVIPGKRSNALYYYKQALRYKDQKMAQKFLDEYNALGGKREGLSQSIKASAPLSMLGNKRKAFLDSLSPQEQEAVRRAEEWYRRVYGRPTTP